MTAYGENLTAVVSLIVDVEGDLASARSLVGDERVQVVADLAETLDGLRRTVARLRAVTPATAGRMRGDEDGPGEVELQASWGSGVVVVWASGRGATPDSWRSPPSASRRPVGHQPRNSERG
ncbi:MAG TPA: hypothetical protein VLA55_03910 [Ornithinibacter sp.]|nr:hypothetical protein [Ornithinibacter sp.]